MSRYCKTFAVLFASLIIAGATSAGVPTGTVLFVDDDAAAGGDGLTWDTAYRFLQNALSAASNGGIAEIHIAQGTYKPDRDEANPEGTGDREATFQLINNVSLIGGYAGIGEDDPDARDFDLYVSNLNGNIGFVQTPNDNSLHIVSVLPAISDASLDGFLISEGKAEDFNIPNGKDGAGVLFIGGAASISNCRFASNFANDNGGCISISDGGSANILHCIFENNIAGDWGGSIFVNSSSATAVDCLFDQSEASVAGAVMVATKSNVSFSDCIFSNNTAFVSGAVEIGLESVVLLNNCTFNNNIASDGDGGAFRINNSNVDFINCSFFDNSTVKNFTNGGALYIDGSIISINQSTFQGNNAQSGGAIRLGSSSEAKISDSVFRSNIAAKGFGGIVVSNSVLEALNCQFIDNHALQQWAGAVGFSTGFKSKMTNCIFIGNTAPLFGGAVSMIETEPSFTNCLFSANTADEGGAMMINQAQPNLINCTFAGNIGNKDGGAFFSLGSQSSATIANCIFWENSDPGGDDESAQIFIDNGDVDIAFSCVQGLTGQLGGIGNIGDNPLFVDADGPDDIPGTEDDDLRLSSGSPCIDAADNTAVPNDVTTDLDGNPRFVDDPDTKDTGNGKTPIVDMGAYEFQGLGVIEAQLDIKPGSCPNSFNRNSHGNLPTTLLGTDDFDAEQIDISSLQISRADKVGGSVAPMEGPPGPHSVLSDAGTPFDGKEACDCHDLEGDGITDLVMHFDTQTLVIALELNDLEPGSFIELVITGMMLDESPFAATDCIRLVPAGDMNGDGYTGLEDLLVLFGAWGNCTDCFGCDTDLDGDCSVGVNDLVILIADWTL